MDLSTVHTKTAKGVMQVNQKTTSLARDLMQVLKFVDGRSNVKELSGKADMPVLLLEKALQTLAKEGFVKVFEVRSSGDTNFGDDFDFTAPGRIATPPASKAGVAVAPTSRPQAAPGSTEAAALTAAREKAQAEARARAEREAQIRARLEVEARSKVDAEKRAIVESRRVQEASERARKELEDQLAKEKVRKDAISNTHARLTQEQRQQEEEQSKVLAALRAKAEAEVKALADARAKAEAETVALAQARAQAEAAAKRQAEQAEQAHRDLREQLKQEIEAKIRQEIEEKLRVEITEQGREELEVAVIEEAREEARVQLEKRLAVEGASLAKIEAESKQNAEEEMRRMLAEQETRLRAEMEQRIKAETEALQRASIEARQMAEKEAQERAEVEKRLRAEAEALQRASIEARQMAEKGAQERAALEEKLKAEAEARARVEQEAQARMEERLRTETEALQRASLEARILAEKEALERAELQERLKAEEQARARVEQESAERLLEEQRRREEDEQRREVDERNRRRLEARAREETEQRERLETEMVLRHEEEQRAKLEAAKELNAERRAREEAEIKAEEEAAARAIAVRAATEKMDAKSKLVAEAESRLLLERTAREKAEAKSRGQEEEEERYRQAQVTRLRELQEQAELAQQNREAGEASGTAVRRKRRRPPRGFFYWVRWALAGVVAIALFLLVALPLFPLGAITTKMEKGLSAWLQDDVSVTGVRIALLPRPRLKIDAVSIGKVLDVKATSGVAYLDLATLFDDRLSIDQLELDNVSVSPEALPRIAKWNNAQGRPANVQIKRVVLRALKLDIKNVALEPMDVDLQFDKGVLRKAVVKGGDGKWTFEAKPDGDVWHADFSARSIVLPLGTPVTLVDVKASGTLTDQELVVPEFEATSLKAAITGSLHANWSDNIALSLDTTLKNMNLADLFANYTHDIQITGRMDGAFALTAKSATIGDLLKTPNIQGGFTVKDGSVSNADLVQLMRSQESGARGGATKFSELAGTLQIDGGAIRYSKLKLTGGVVLSNGDVAVLPNGALTGRIGVEIRSSVAQDRGTFNVAGTVARPLLKRGI